MTENKNLEPPVPLEDGFDRPRVVTEIQIAFPAFVSDMMPVWDTIPVQFRSANDLTDWNKFVSRWFNLGYNAAGDLFPREDIDPNLAFRHLTCIIRSYEPKHEHKLAAVAWLASRWFDDVEVKD